MKIEWIEVPGKRKPRLERWASDIPAGTLVRVRYQNEERVILFGDVDLNGSDSGSFSYYDKWCVVACSTSLCGVVKEAKNEKTTS